MIRQFSLDHGELARRIDGREVRGVFARGVVADPYLRVIHIKDGSLIDIHTGGSVDMGSLLDKLLSLKFTETHSVIIVNAHDFNIGWDFYRVMLKSGISVDMSFEIRAQVSNPSLFYANLMQSEKTIPLSSLKGRYYNELDNMVRTYLAGLTFDSLSLDREAKDRFQIALEKHLHTTFSRDGILLIQINCVKFVNKEISAIKEGRAEILLNTRLNKLMSEQERLKREQQISRAEMEIEFDKKTGELKLASQASRIEYYMKKSELWDAVRKELMKRKIEKLQGDKELEDLIRNLDRDKLLKGSDYQRLKDEISYAGEDRALERKHILDRVEAEREHDLKIMKMIQSQDVDEKSLAFKLSQERRLLEESLAISRMKNEASRSEEKADLLHKQQLDMQKRMNELEAQKNEKSAARAQAILDAKAQLEVEKIKIEITNGWQEIKRLKEEEELAREIKRKREFEAIQLQADQGRLKLKIEEEWNRHKMAMERDRLGLESKEMDLKFSLEKEKIKKDVDVATSGYAKEAEVAKAKIELVQDHSKELQKQRDGDNERYDRMVRENISGQKDVMEKAIDKISEVAVAYAGSKTPQIINQMVPASPPAPVEPSCQKLCTNCMSKNQLNAKFCFNCGRPFA